MNFLPEKPYFNVQIMKIFNVQIMRSGFFGKILFFFNKFNENKATSIEDIVCSIGHEANANKE